MTENGSPTLGEFLRQERERRGITIEQVASATKIAVRVLHSLESDQYAELPAKPFIRGFVGSYCRFIGVDAPDVLSRYTAYIDHKLQDRPNRDGGHSGYAFEKQGSGEQSRSLLWAVMGTFAIMVALAVFFIKKPGKHRGTNVEKLQAMQSPSPQPAPVVGIAAAPTGQIPVDAPSPAPKPSVLAVAEVPSPSPEPAPVPVPAPPPPEPAPVVAAPPPPAPSPSPETLPVLADTAPVPVPAPSADPDDPLNSGARIRSKDIRHKIIVRAVGDVRVRYQSDNRPVMNFILRKERILVVRASSTIIFQFTRPENLMLNYNSTGEKPVASFKSLTERQKDATLFFPPQLAETLQDPFPGKGRLTQGVQ